MRTKKRTNNKIISKKKNNNFLNKADKLIRKYWLNKYK